MDEVKLALKFFSNSWVLATKLLTHLNYVLRLSLKSLLEQIITYVGIPRNLKK